MEIPKWLRFINGTPKHLEPKLILPEPSIVTKDITETFKATFSALQSASPEDESVNGIYWSLKKYLNALIDLNGLDPLLAYQIAQTDSGISFECGTNKHNYQRIFRPAHFDGSYVGAEYMSETTVFAKDTLSRMRCVMMSTYHTDPNTQYGINNQIYGEYQILKNDRRPIHGRSFTLTHAYSPEGDEQSFSNLAVINN